MKRPTVQLMGWGCLLIMAAAACQPAQPPESSWPAETAPVAERPVARSPVSTMPVPSASQGAAPQPLGEAAALTAQDGDEVLLYEEPGSEFAVATAVPGEAIQVLRAQRLAGGAVWYYGQLPDGGEGWVEGAAVSFTKNQSRTPYVVLPEGGSVYQQPQAEAQVVQELEGGSVIAAEQRPDQAGEWLYSGGGWISGESLFQPACIEFNGSLPLVVMAGGTTVHDTAAYQIPVKQRLDGGELVFPSEVTENATGTWFKIDQGWVSGQSLFYPFCGS